MHETTDMRNIFGINIKHICQLFAPNTTNIPISLLVFEMQSLTVFEDPKMLVIIVIIEILMNIIPTFTTPYSNTLIEYYTSFHRCFHF